jgi:hypothetical protein
MAFRHAWMVSNILPVKHVGRILSDGTFQPCVPYTLYFNSKPNIWRFRVFGCPCIVKIYRRTDADSGAVLDSRNQPQRGVRAIHVDFPLNQAGWQVYIPASGHLLASGDIAFKEDFLSTLAHDERLFRDGLPHRSAAPY